MKLYPGLETRIDVNKSDYNGSLADAYERVRYELAQNDEDVKRLIHLMNACYDAGQLDEMRRRRP